MPSASLSHSAYRNRSSARSRLTALVLAIAVAALVVAMLIELGFLPLTLPNPQRPMATFDVPPDRPVTPTLAHALTKTIKPSGGSAAPVRAPKTLPPPAATFSSIPGMIQLNSAEFASSDVGKMAAQASDNAAGAGGGKDSGTTYGPGEGPGGETLYNADWYRRPTDAELSFYLPKNRDNIGFGMVACRTVPGNRVENCREIGETPGSGLGRAVRLAAWQFQVLPPRIGGKPIIGAWVRIRIEWTPGGMK
ncbi:hypothetical protein EAH79_16120 [Sphingomonas koreensis]|nr:hypothetical protein EAH79_16120 [Sphingomonas koreensis]